MSSQWIAVCVLGVATVGLKTAGPLLIGGRPVGDRLAGRISAMVPATLVALVVVGTVADGRDIALDARLVGMAAAGTAVALRLPLVAIVIVAAVGTALARQLAAW